MSQARGPIQSTALLVATLFGAGRVPFAPGTVGTAAALPLVLLAGRFLTPWGFAIAALAVTLVGLWAAGVTARLLGQHDPQVVVIDEAAGLFVALIGLPTHTWMVIGAFLLFRVFDVLKPPPAAGAERLAGGLGIMADDLIAGAYANLALRAIRFVYQSVSV